jgi:hypothetical protein
MPWAVRIVGVTRALKLTEADRDALFDAFTDQERRIFTALVRNMESRQAKIDSIVETLRLNRLREGMETLCSALAPRHCGTQHLGPRPSA